MLGEQQQLGVEEPRRRPRPSGSSSRATSARTALKPHCASEKPRAQRRVRRSRLYAREITSRFGPAHDARAAARAACRSRRRCGRRRAARRAAAARRGRSRGRRPCTRRRRASLADHTVAQRAPAALAVEVDGAHARQLGARGRARSTQVPSVLALSAIVMRHENGNCSDEVARAAARSLGARSRCLVVDGHDDLDRRLGRRAGGVSARSRRGVRSPAVHAARPCACRA